jgi:hypothetical protein
MGTFPSLQGAIHEQSSLFLLGECVGTTYGSPEGKARDGVKLGVWLGSELGYGLGCLLGIADGVVDGVAVGRTEGFCGGFGDGNEDGDSEAHWISMHHSYRASHSFVNASIVHVPCACVPKNASLRLSSGR